LAYGLLVLLTPKTVASFLVPWRAVPLLSIKSVASFFKSSQLSALSYQHNEPVFLLSADGWWHSLLPFAFLSSCRPPTADGGKRKEGGGRLPQGFRPGL